jgi:cell division protein ZapA
VVCDGDERITINIAGRNYPLNVPATEEETLRKVGKQIETMIREFEANFDVKDKQDALAMCALKLGANAEVHQLNNEKIVQNANERLTKLNQLLDEIEK